MPMDIAGTALIIFLLYGWPAIIGLGCCIGSDSDKLKSSVLGMLKGYMCLLVAVFLSWLIFLAVDLWVIPHANSVACIERTPNCKFGLLNLSEWVVNWNFIVFEICAVLVAVTLGLKQVTAFNKNIKERPSG